ncbi:MAG: hypothetical protein JXA39_05925 [Bacteroidales bacterium]|nr:hypothetical protein [Bacteroidales bacterium]
MKKKAYKIKRLLLSLFLILLISLSLSAQNASKEISKTYDVRKGFTMNVNSKYSDIELLTWDQDVLDVLIVMEVDAGSEERSGNLLDKIDVDISETDNSVSFVTEFNFNGTPGRNVEIAVKYSVKLPSYLNLTVENSYGNVYLQELAGVAALDVQYGNLKVNKLTRGNDKPYNKLEIAYGNLEIEEAGWIELNASYSDCVVSNADMLFVKSKYSKFYGEHAGAVITEGKYDKYMFDEIDNFVGELKYSNVRFDRLNTKFDLNASYTNVKIEMLPKGFEKIRSDQSYGNFFLVTEKGNSFNLNAQSNYGGIDVVPESNLKRSRDNGTMKVTGTVGSPSKSEVEVITRYGNIDIK